MKLKALLGAASAGSLLYVVVVASVATVGFVGKSTWPLVVAVILTLPMSLIAVPGFYLAYGLLALVPGANPSVSSGSGGSADGGAAVAAASTESAASWFTTSTSLIGILALTGAAVINVGLARRLRHRRQQTYGHAGASLS